MWANGVTVITKKLLNASLLAELGVGRVIVNYFKHTLQTVVSIRYELSPAYIMNCCKHTLWTVVSIRCELLQAYIMNCCKHTLWTVVSICYELLQAYVMNCCKHTLSHRLCTLQSKRWWMLGLSLKWEWIIHCTALYLLLHLFTYARYYFKKRVWDFRAWVESLSRKYIQPFSVFVFL